MILRKFEHACFVVEFMNKSLVVDPGIWTTDFIIPNNVVAVFVSHEHSDHMSIDLLQKIVVANPSVIIIGHEDVTRRLAGLPVKTVTPGHSIEIHDFTLEFFGGSHATISSKLPAPPNLGLLVNSRLYYGGDSFTVPDRPIEVLALPIAAPWLKFTELIDYLDAIKPRVVFTTHDAILSATGKSLLDTMIRSNSDASGANYIRLSQDSTVEI